MYIGTDEEVTSQTYGITIPHFQGGERKFLNVHDTDQAVVVNVDVMIVVGVGVIE